MKSIKLFFVLLTAVTVAACGGGSGTTTSPFPHTQATISLSAVSTTGSAPTAQLSQIRMTVKLPPGASMSDVPADIAAAVVGRNGHSPQLPSYSKADNTVSFSLSEANIKLGETFVDVICNIDKGVTDASFSAANTPSFPFLEIIGVNPTTGDSVDLLSQINIAMAVASR